MPPHAKKSKAAEIISRGFNPYNFCAQVQSQQKLCFHFGLNRILIWDQLLECVASLDFKIEQFQSGAKLVIANGKQ